jgi:hypothetical protein
MRDQIEDRLKTLKSEFQAGQEILAELAARETNVRMTMARISGAMQVLEELLNGEAASEPALKTTSENTAGS